MYRFNSTRTLAGVLLLLAAAPGARAQEMTPAEVLGPQPDPFPAAAGRLWTAPSDSGLGELERLAVDIGRRTLLAYHPHVARNPIHTVEIEVRPAGDVVHTYARLMSFKDRDGEEAIESEVFATLIYTRGMRRLIDLSYRDNNSVPRRMHNRTADVVTAFNTEFERRDPLQMPAPVVGSRMDVLAPRSRGWIWSPFQGGRGWHVFNAGDRVRNGWFD